MLRNNTSRSRINKVAFIAIIFIASILLVILLMALNSPIRKANFKTYNSAIFSIDYPADYTHGYEGEVKYVFKNKPGDSIAVDELPAEQVIFSKENFDDAKEAFLDGQENVDMIETTIGDYYAIITSNYRGDQYTNTAHIFDNNRVWIIKATYYPDSELANLYDHIFSTFSINLAQRSL